jgi:hypothetical protein
LKPNKTTTKKGGLFPYFPLRVLAPIQAKPEVEVTKEAKSMGQPIDYL